MGLSFSAVLRAIKEGYRATRRGWAGKHQWVCMSPGFHLPADAVFSTPIANEIGDGTGEFRPYLMMCTEDGSFVPWVATQTDLLAEDWSILGSGDLT